MVLEQVLSAINAPSRTPASAYSLSDRQPSRSDLMKRAQIRLDEVCTSEAVEYQTGRKIEVLLTGWDRLKGTSRRIYRKLG